VIARPLEQGSPAWKLWRRDGIGGSDLAAILGISPFADATRAALLVEKVTGRERETNFSMRRGTRLEPVARELYARHAGCTALPVCVEHADAPYIRCSLDGLCAAHPRVAGSRQWVLELKCPNWKVHELALNGLVPDYYAVQCQWQLLCTGLDRCDFASFNDGGRFGPDEHLAVVTLTTDAEVQGRCLEAAEPFWAEVVAGRAAVRRERAGRQANAGASWTNPAGAAC
jgi:putative phage-type endonuclease